MLAYLKNSFCKLTKKCLDCCLFIVPEDLPQVVKLSHTNKYFGNKCLVNILRLLNYIFCLTILKLTIAFYTTGHKKILF